jgi:hypothetical protein
VFPAAIIAIAISMLPLIVNAKRKLLQNSGEYTYYKEFYRQLDEMSFLRNNAIVADGASSLESVQLCYYFKCRYYCTWRNEPYEEIKRMNIKYLISKSWRSESFLQLKTKLHIKTNTLYVYEIK